MITPWDEWFNFSASSLVTEEQVTHITPHRHHQDWSSVAHEKTEDEQVRACLYHTWFCKLERLRFLHCGAQVLKVPSWQLDVVPATCSCACFHPGWTVTRAVQALPEGWDKLMLQLLRTLWFEIRDSMTCSQKAELQSGRFLPLCILRNKECTEQRWMSPFQKQKYSSIIPKTSGTFCFIPDDTS